MRRICALISICYAISTAKPANPQQLLTQFRPSAERSISGPLYEVEFSTGLVELDSGSLAHHVPYAMKNVRFAEQVWIVGYRTDILDAKGKTPRENYLCHTFLADQRVAQHDGEELRGIYSDAFTPEVRMPEGLGVRVSPDQTLHWMPMFNNRTPESVRVQMRVVLTVLRDKDRVKPIRPLQATLRSVQSPHLFFVPPGESGQRLTFQMPFNGKIHFLGTHIHPYGVSVELFNETAGESVWRGLRKVQPDGPMNVYSSAEGYSVKAGDKYRIISTYRNTTSEKIDAMAGLFILYSPD